MSSIRLDQLPPHPKQSRRAFKTPNHQPITVRKPSCKLIHMCPLNFQIHRRLQTVHHQVSITIDELAIDRSDKQKPWLYAQVQYHPPKSLIPTTIYCPKECPSKYVSNLERLEQPRRGFHTYAIKVVTIKHDVH
ncbi:hypothetical protein M9H77_24166 [Catharanthus roseus]|uniref:Uncharacterized protein n=1 Tax=Catharanthus roseus TaxID=4058 RepID=A0ACC0AV30_CATRO|nr:hypothetical protein M9H77_24166 [Catharanthus roseus]